jgi:hypothetical protein
MPAGHVHKCLAPRRGEPGQVAKFTVVYSDMFDLKSKVVERNILPMAVFCICLNSTSDPLDLLEKRAQ